MFQAVLSHKKRKRKKYSLESYIFSLVYIFLKKGNDFYDKK